MKKSFCFKGKAIGALMTRKGSRFIGKVLFISGIIFILMTQSLMAAARIERCFTRRQRSRTRHQHRRSGRFER
jgi:hypothetical protein